MMTEPTFGSEMRRLRTAAGLSLSDLAALIHYSKGYLSKVENGIAQPNHTLAALCDGALASEGTLVAVVPRNPRRRGRPRTRPLHTSSLPAEPAYFTGRSAEVTAVCTALLDDSPTAPAVCVIDGMAGVGKTALALHAAHRVQDHFPDGGVFLDLRGCDPDGHGISSTEALDRLLRMLGVPGERIPVDPDDRAAFYRGCLRDQRLLLILDNTSSARQVRTLLPGGRTCRVLVTSRNRLAALDDDRHFSLDALSVAESTTLFTTVAARGEFPSDQQVVAIVNHCDRLPLAVRIAAARYRANQAWSLADLDERLRDRDTVLDELDDGERSVHTALTLSYRGLETDQRRLLGLLAGQVITDIDTRAAAAVGELPVGETARLLNRLHDAHLLVQRTSGRYEFHDLVRLFARRAAVRDLSRDQRDGAFLRLLDHLTHAAEAAERRLNPLRFLPETAYERLTAARREFADSAEALSWLRIEWPNLVAACRAAAGQGMRRRCWQLAFMLRGYFFLSKLWDPWIETHTLALEAATADGDLWAQGATLNNLGVAHVDRGDIEPARSCYERALAVFEALDDEHGSTTALANLGWARHYHGENEAARRDLSAALDFYLRAGADRNALITMRGLALAEIELGAYAAAVEHLTEAQRLLDELGAGHDLDAAMTSNCLGWTHFRRGAHDAAADAYRRALVLADQAGSRYEMARAETGLGNIAAAADRTAEAERYWDLAEDHCPELNETTVAESRVRRSGP